jgi:hypothetical protein
MRSFRRRITWWCFLVGRVEDPARAAQLEDFVTRQHPADAVSGDSYGMLLSLYRADIPRLPAAE